MMFMHHGCLIGLLGEKRGSKNPTGVRTLGSFLIRQVLGGVFWTEEAPGSKVVAKSKRVRRVLVNFVEF
jgi:hypothetical protein